MIKVTEPLTSYYKILQLTTFNYMFVCNATKQLNEK